MSRKVIGYAAIVIGLILIVISVFADQIGLGAAQGIFGWKQILGTGLGVILLIVGIVFSLRPGSKK